MTTEQEKLGVAGTNLLVDVVTREVAGAFDEADISFLVLRGPALSRWLGDPLRSSGDVDLLVPPEEDVHARDVLRALGYRQVLPGDATTAHATTWGRDNDPVAIDLHVTVVGARSDPVRLWAALGTGVENEMPGGPHVRVPGVSARLLLLALHAAQHGIREPSTLRDLENGLRLSDEGQWREALQLARRIEAVDAFAGGLRLVQAGARLADRLELPETVTAAVALRAATAPHTALGIERLMEAEGIRKRLRILAQELIPSPAFMRDWHSLARRRVAGLVLAYVYRPFWLASRAVPGYLAWRRARNRARSR